MKKFFLLFLSCVLIGCLLTNCATARNKYDSLHHEDKQALSTLTGGILGILVQGSTLGAIAGAFTGDIANLFFKEEPKPIFPEEEDEAKRNGFKSAKLTIQEILINPESVANGATFEAHVRYILSGSAPEHEVRVTEKMVLTNLSDKNLELTQRDVFRTEGEYSFTIKFTIPDDVPKGDYILFTTISNGSSAGRVKSSIKVI